MRFIELFAGIGGFRLGLEKANQDLSGTEKGQVQNGDRGHSANAGVTDGRGREQRAMYRCVWANDNNKYTCQIYRKHWGSGELVEANIKTIDPLTIPPHDLLTAGFPCQSFSVAGKRKGFADTRGTLFYEILRVARAKKPKLLLLENVRGLLSHDEGLTYQVILESLDELGYLAEWQVLNSKHHGVPQNRRRVFIIGHLRGGGGREVFPLRKPGEVADRGITEEQTANALQSPGHASGNYRGMNMLKIGNIAKSGHDSIWGRVYNPDGLAVNLNAEGGGVGAKTGLYAVLTPDREKKRQHGRQFKEDGVPMFTLTGQDVHGVTIANAVDCDGYLRFGHRPRDEHGKPQLIPIGYRRRRRLTPVECERLQGFPDGWTEGVSDTQRYKALGNAVTVNVIEALGRAINKTIIY